MHGWQKQTNAGVWHAGAHEAMSAELLVAWSLTKSIMNSYAEYYGARRLCGLLVAASSDCLQPTLVASCARPRSEGF